MALFIAIIFGLILVGSTNNPPESTQAQKEKIEILTNKVAEEKPIISEIKPKTDKLEQIEKSIDPEPKKQELTKEEIKPLTEKKVVVEDQVISTAKTQELIEEEKIKTIIKESKLIKEEIKSETTKEEINSETTKEEINSETTKEEINSETIKEAESTDEPGTSWLMLVLYILGPILIIILGKNLYSRLKNNSSSNKTNDYMRKEFKEEVQPDTSETAQEEVQPDTADQQPLEEDDNKNK